MLALSRHTAIRLGLYAALVLLLGNLGALVDLVVNPELGYFDGEHLLEGAVVAAVVVALLALLEVFLARQRQAEAALRKSEARLQDLVFALGDWVWEVDERGVYTFSSGQSRRLFGPARSDVLGKTPFDFMPPEEGERVRALFEQIAANKAPIVDLENWNLDDAGERFCLLTNAVPILDAAGELKGYRGVDKDVTEQRRTAEALRASEERYRTLTESSGDFIFIVDRQLRLVYLNQTGTGAFGRPLDDLAGLPLGDLFGDAPASRMATLMADVFASGVHVRDETVWPMPWGTMWFSTLLTPLRDESGAVSMVFGVARDVTALKETERELAELNADLEREVERRTGQLREANAELEAFAYSVSHDLRGPLRAIDGFSQILIEDEQQSMSDAGRENLRRVRAAAQRMGKLIDALLALSRLSRHPVTFEEVDLSGVADAILTGLREEEPGRRVDVVVVPGCTAVSDPALVEVVLANLLGNAWKFTSGLAQARIEFGVVTVADDCAYYVRDDGAGFDQEYVNKLFEPFQRLHADADYPGTGIGLATVRRVVTRLGGRCWAEGTVGEGATFFFTLPEPPGQRTISRA